MKQATLLSFLFSFNLGYSFFAYGKIDGTGCAGPLGGVQRSYDVRDDFVDLVISKSSPDSSTQDRENMRQELALSIERVYGSTTESPRYQSQEKDLQFIPEGDYLPPEKQQILNTEEGTFLLFHRLGASSIGNHYLALLGQGIVHITRYFTPLSDHETHRLEGSLKVEDKARRFLAARGEPVAQPLTHFIYNNSYFSVKEYFVGETEDDLYGDYTKGTLPEEQFDQLQSKKKAFKERLYKLLESYDYIKYARKHTLNHQFVLFNDDFTYLDGAWRLR